MYDAYIGIAIVLCIFWVFASIGSCIDLFSNYPSDKLLKEQYNRHGTQSILRTIAGKQAAARRTIAIFLLVPIGILAWPLTLAGLLCYLVYLVIRAAGFKLPAKNSKIKDS